MNGSREGLVLVLGGARSGKSAVAETMAAESEGRVIYVATGEAVDAEMSERIARHRARRDPTWQTLEVPRELAASVRRAGGPDVTFLVDGVGTWVSNLLLDGGDDTRVATAVDDLLLALSETGARAVLVSDETGLGVIPPTALGRQFRDLIGTVNQRLAAAAGQVLWVVAGLAVDLASLAVRRAPADPQPALPPPLPSPSPAAGAMGARTIMVQGTASNVGKSLLVTALCRIFREDGYRVAPFKSQNMSNNSYITPAGHEIGRAQGIQAEAAGVEATADMNPVLLKPSGEGTSQVVIHGRPYAEMDFRRYRGDGYDRAAGAIRESLARLRSTYEIVVIEGAGSPAEVNLKERELVNMRIAAWSDAPVLLVGDIDRGGVLAALVGTLALLQPEERERVAGLVINKFRGDPALLAPAVTFLQERTGKPVLGVVPLLDTDLEAEDSLALPHPAGSAAGADTPGPSLQLCAIRFPHISNFTDLDPLRQAPGVQLTYADRPAQLAGADAVLLPGTKNTGADLQWLWTSGLAGAIRALAADGCPVVGICGGFQMLGQRVADPAGVESPWAETPGLGLLDVDTVFAPAPDKITRRAHGRLLMHGGPFAGCQDTPVAGYEVHMGRTRLGPDARALLLMAGEDPGSAAASAAGASNAGGAVWGTYLHDIFHNDALRQGWLNWLWQRRGIASPPTSATAGREATLTDLAAAVRQHLDMTRIYRLLGLPGPRTGALPRQGEGGQP